MATYKIMLVEDDNNLRAIYGERLMAEGYEIVSARDGEEALAMAVKEKPDLIISDVMMPKISGFDMLDILRTTPETKDVKVIMMTALSQAEDKERADKLGADKYLVKSQVTLEDVARVVHEVLGDDPSATAEEAPAPTPEAVPVATAPEQSVPVVPLAPANPFEAPAAAPIVEPVAVAPVVSNPFEATPPAVESPALAPAPTTAPVPEVALSQPEMPAIVAPVPGPVAPTPDPVQSAPIAPAGDPVAPMAAASAPEPVAVDETPAGDPVGSKRVIQPISDNVGADATPKIYELYEKEMATQAAMAPVVNPTANTVITAPVEPATPAPEPEQVAPAPNATFDQPPQAPGSTAPGAVFDPNSVSL